MTAPGLPLPTGDATWILFLSAELPLSFIASPKLASLHITNEVTSGGFGTWEQLSHVKPKKIIDKFQLQLKRTTP